MKKSITIIMSASMALSACITTQGNAARASYLELSCEQLAEEALSIVANSRAAATRMQNAGGPADEHSYVVLDNDDVADGRGTSTNPERRIELLHTISQERGCANGLETTDGIQPLN